MVSGQKIEANIFVRLWFGESDPLSIKYNLSCLRRNKQLKLWLGKKFIEEKQQFQYLFNGNLPHLRINFIALTLSLGLASSSDTVGQD